MKTKEVDFSLGQGEKHPDRRGYQTPAVGLLRKMKPESCLCVLTERALITEIKVTKHIQYYPFL